jgi:hypothetical protein
MLGYFSRAWSQAVFINLFADNSAALSGTPLPKLIIFFSAMTSTSIFARRRG